MKQPKGYSLSEGLWFTVSTGATLRPWSEASELLQTYAETLLRATSRRNLISTAQRNPESIWEHICDSINALHLIAYDGIDKCLDIGSGNGLPAIPLAIAMPSVQFVLVERSNWKVDYLSYLSGILKLENVHAINKPVTSKVITDRSPDMITLRALINARGALRAEWLCAITCPIIIFATLRTEEAWRRNLSAVNMQVVARHEYELPSRDAHRVLLKFSRN